MSFPIVRRVSLALGLLAVSGCDGQSAEPEAATPDAMDDMALPADGGVVVDAAPMVEGLTAYPDGCAADGDCDGDSCRVGVCVPAPPADRPSEYSCDDAPQPGSTPDLSCWFEPPELAEGPATVPARGLVEFFGEGEQTVGLRVRFYDYATFDPSSCKDAGARARTVADAREAVERCLDESLDANPDTAPLADTVSAECDPPVADSGCWAVDALPTGRPLVARVTGSFSEWVPTYQYGLIINPCQAPAARFDTGVCPESLNLADPALDWACGLVDAVSPHHAGAGAGTYWYRNISVISQRTWDSFPQTAGEVRINQGFGAVAGRLYDCDGRSVVHATFGLANPGRRDTYFNGNAADTLPSPGRVTTNLLGTYANLNTPPGPNGMVAVARIDGTPDLVAYERFFLLPDTVTIVNPTGRGPVQVEPPY